MRAFGDPVREEKSQKVTKKSAKESDLIRPLNFRFYLVGRPIMRDSNLCSLTTTTTKTRQLHSPPTRLRNSTPPLLTPEQLMRTPTSQATEAIEFGIPLAVSTIRCLLGRWKVRRLHHRLEQQLWITNYPSYDDTSRQILLTPSLRTLLHNDPGSRSEATAFPTAETTKMSAQHHGGLSESNAYHSITKSRIQPFRS